VDDLVAALGIDSGISKSEVSRICAGLDEVVTAFRTRRLDHTTFPYVYLDATYLHVRISSSQVVSMAVVVATGITADGGTGQQPFKQVTHTSNLTARPGGHPTVFSAVADGREPAHISDATRAYAKREVEVSGRGLLARGPVERHRTGPVSTASSSPGMPASAGTSLA